MATVSGHNQCNKFFFRLINRVGKITDFGYSINRVRVWEAGCTPPPWDINTKTRISQIVTEFYVLTSNPKMNPSCRTHNQIYGQKKAIDQHLGKEHGCSTDKNQSNLFTLNIYVDQTEVCSSLTVWSKIPEYPSVNQTENTIQNWMLKKIGLHKFISLTNFILLCSIHQNNNTTIPVVYFYGK